MSAQALWTRDAVLAATGGHAQGPDWRADGVSIDSRSITPGDLFVALAGPVHDGHSFVGAALANGAAAALVAHVPQGVGAEAPLVLVDDPLLALRKLGMAGRRRSAARIVAVTGSVGKTGTKEMLRLALAAGGTTYASTGSLNNHWGVPLSLARLPPDAQYAVFELGMNHAGEIADLTRLVRPHVGVITAVESAHLEFFKSTAEIAIAKAEIFEGVQAGGAAVLPRDNPHFGLLQDAARAAGIERILSFGSHIDASARLLDAAIDPDATLVFALAGDLALGYRIGAPGVHWATNSLAVLLAAQAVGVDIQAAAKSLAAMTAPKGRGTRVRVAWSGGQVEIIDDSYNANPASMRAAIATLAAARPGHRGRRIAVLGDMLELGAEGPQLHAALVTPLTDWRIDLVLTAGPLMRNLHDALPRSLRAGHAEDADAAAVQLLAILRAGDLVLVKGSRGSAMGRVLAALEKADTQTPLRPAANGN